MSTYVVSDIHGCYMTFLKLLEQAGFTDGDTLYIGGDIIDRGDGFLELFKWIKDRHGKNVFMSLGNHELYFMEDLIDDVNSSNGWTRDSYGSIRFLREVKHASDENLREMFQFFNELPLFYDIEVGGKRYIIVHAYITEDDINYPDRMDEYDTTFNRGLATEQGWNRTIDGATVIFGHTPTLFEFYPSDVQGFIYREKGVSDDGKHYEKINIDGGCVWRAEGNLALLRLDDMAEFYEKRIDGKVEEFFLKEYLGGVDS